MIEKLMRVAPLSEREKQYVEKLIAYWGGRRSFRSKQCWKNAQRLIIADDERRLRYCEGNSSNSGAPIPHAWVTIHGKVVDVTREAAIRKLKRMKISMPMEREYAGVAINRRRVLKHVQRAGYWCSFVDWDRMA